MRTIQINDDVYIYLLSRTAYIGEDASSILRRLLDIPENEAGQEDPGRHLSANHKDQNSSRVSRNGAAVDRFLAALSELYGVHGEDFRRVVIQVRGKRRRYFAEDRETLLVSGNSVDPKIIPGSSLWAVTNNDTPKKRKILQEVLSMLGYSREKQNEWIEKI